ncbi:response regulator [Egicoccus sp. AB-alg2]|uniref:response regulator n=1 Tax=Egicoccus sp. AB-alg2 TaxID=3242693 RepID=UPI00359EDAE2
MTVRVVLADDHQTFRANLRLLLDTLQDVEVVAEAGDGGQAVTAATSLAADVVLMDLHMPGGDGIRATERLVRETPHVGVLVLTTFEDESAIAAALSAGARGYLLKGASRDELSRAITAVARGEAFLGAPVARRVGGLLARGTAAPLPELSDRERELLAAVAAGESTQRVAARLHLSPKTVRNHLTSIYAKLGVGSRAEAVARARDAGLGAPTDRFG